MSHPIEENNAERFSIEKESQYFDRKSARKDPRDLARHISGFANASGGKLVIGIENNGEITGFKRESAHDITGFKQAPLTECSPIPMVNSTEVAVVNSDGNKDSILVMDIKASVDRVIARKKDGAVFLRQQDKTVELNHEQILALEYDRNQRCFEDEIVRRSNIVDAVGVEKYDSLNEYEVAAVQYVYLRGKITTKILSEQLDRGSTLCSKILKGLVEKNILTWHGTSSNDPSQYYSLPEQ